MITWEEFQVLLDKELGVQNKEQEQLELGYTKGVYLGEPAFSILDTWVAYVDQQLALPKNDSLRKKAALMSTRLFTFKEYLMLFESKISEEAFSWFPIFEVLLIRNETERKVLTTNLSPDAQGYIELLQKYRKIPIADFFFRKIGIAISEPDLQRHCYISGKSGSGKSELMKALFYQLQKKENSTLVMLDPHGDLAEDLTKFHLNKEQRDSIIYIDPYLFPDAHPVINPFEINDRSEESIDLCSQELSKVIQELVEGSLSMQMEAVLIPCLATLLRERGTSLADLQIFMDDNLNQEWIAKGLQSPNQRHREFFKNAFSKTTYSSTKQAIYTRIQSLLNHRVFSNLMTGNSTVNLEKAVNGKKVIIFNLSQGKMGEDVSKAYGKFLISMITSYALKRASVPKEKRVATYLFIDEFQNYLTKSIEKIVAETRKYKLYLVMANQNLAQIQEKKLKETILSNTNVKILGANSSSTLKTLSAELHITMDHIQQLEKYEFYIKAGERSAFRMKSSYVLNEPAFQLSSNDQKAFEVYQHTQGFYRPTSKDEFATTTVSEPQAHAQEEKPYSEQTIEERVQTKNTNPPTIGEAPPKPKYGF